MVSGSRISPITITSGAWRSAARSAVGKSGASIPISTCSTTLCWCACSYSIGSSIVMMCFASRLLISLTSAATVVVFPDPVAPPTRTRPWCRRVIDSTCDGRPSSASSGGRDGSARTVAAACPRSRCRLTRKRPSPDRRRETSADPLFRYRSSACGWSAGSTAASIASPSSAGSGSGVTSPFIRMAGGKPDTRKRSAAPCETRACSQRSRESEVSIWQHFNRRCRPGGQTTAPAV